MSDSILPLQAENLCYQANGRPLIDDVSLSVEAGAFMVVLGPNGAGKSLLLRLLHGLIAPTSGGIDWTGPTATRGEALRTRQAMVFQRPVLLRRSVEANVRYALKWQGVPKAERAAATNAALVRAGLADRRRVPARLLSVGEQQRLVVARALAANPDIMFLDEPTASLDPASVQQIEALLVDANQSGTAIVLVTHDIGQARRLAREIVFVHRGQVIERATAERFFDRPETQAAEAYLKGEIIV
jgi:tungstate transport system ATP-binding protein